MPQKTNLRPYHRALKGKQAPIMQSIHWVANNLGRDISDVQPEEPPCYFAVALLAWANEGNNDGIFLKEFMTKAIPNKTQLETEERLRDDGRALFILDEFQRKFNELAEKQDA